ncbi:MAG: IPExxxVDY family protein [Bacteroidia bacterium]|nr:IPExxxVDY family protein [Bacteroidia bacterium]
MAVHKLHVDEFSDDRYLLFAIHSRIEDYRIAYLLNKHLGIKIERKQNDLDVDYLKSSYAIYEWDNKVEYIIWNLVSNCCVKEEEAITSTGVLFGNNNKIVKTYNLIPELKTVDYLLKISGEIYGLDEQFILETLQKIPQIITSYSVNPIKIKSRENIIF